jgi:hypothetical protein
VYICCGVPRHTASVKQLDLLDIEARWRSFGFKAVGGMVWFVADLLTIIATYPSRSISHMYLGRFIYTCGRLGSVTEGMLFLSAWNWRSCSTQKQALLPGRERPATSYVYLIGPGNLSDLSFMFSC